MHKEIKLENNDKIIVMLMPKNKGLVLSMAGELQTSFGQNFQEIYEQYILGKPEFTKKTELARLLQIWEQYHLNDLIPGTPEQMELLKGKNLNYKEALEYLDALGMKIHNGYEYGSDWLFQEIPSQIIEELENLTSNWEE